MNEHVELLKAYIEELCGHIERKERTLSWPNWRKRALAVGSPIAVGLVVASCGGDVNPATPGTECTGTTCATLCQDGLDNDEDGLVDCADSDCVSAIGCGSSAIYSAPMPETNCADGVDNDADTYIDCADDDCAMSSLCSVAEYGVVMPRETNCADNQDDDEDGYTDCADTDCYGAVSCAVPVYAVGLPDESDCSDGVDNDKNGKVDCADGVCSESQYCRHAETQCGDGSDDDGDGLIDCNDGDCLCGVGLYNTFMEPK